MAAQRITDSLKQVTRLIELVLPLPITTASVERTFSALKRIKTVARNKIGDEQLKDLAILAIESKLSNEIETSEVIEIFAKMKDRRIELHYK